MGKPSKRRGFDIAIELARCVSRRMAKVLAETPGADLADERIGREIGIAAKDKGLAPIHVGVSNLARRLVVERTGGWRSGYTYARRKFSNGGEVGSERESVRTFALAAMSGLSTRTMVDCGGSWDALQTLARDRLESMSGVPPDHLLEECVDELARRIMVFRTGYDVGRTEHLRKAAEESDEEAEQLLGALEATLEKVAKAPRHERHGLVDDAMDAALHFKDADPDHATLHLLKRATWLALDAEAQGFREGWSEAVESLEGSRLKLEESEKAREALRAEVECLEREIESQRKIAEHLRRAANSMSDALGLSL